MRSIYSTQLISRTSVPEFQDALNAAVNGWQEIQGLDIEVQYAPVSKRTGAGEVAFTALVIAYKPEA